MGFLFAIDDGLAAGIAAVITALGVACGVAGGWWLKHRAAEIKARAAESKDRDRRNKTSVNELQDIIDRERQVRLDSEEECRRRMDRQQAQIDDQQRAINRLFFLYAESSTLRLEDYTVMAAFHAGWTRANERLAVLEASVERIPDLPPRPSRDRQAEAEFVRNESQHSTNLVRRATESGSENSSGRK